MRVTPRFFRLSTLASGTALVSVAALMAACGGGDDLGPATTGVLSGTAATGTPITGGRVDVVCASGAPLSATTSATGTYEVALQGQALPCKLKVSGGSLASGVAYHSVALQAGTVNLTPLTDLVVARMAGGAPSAWFSAIAAADFQKLTADAVNTALGAITTGLGLATPLGEKNPMTAAFEAKTTDPLDKILEAIKAAAPSHATLLTAAQGTNWNTLAQTYVAAINAALTGATSGGATNPVSGGGSGGAPTVSPLAPIGFAVFKGSDWGTSFTINKDKVLGDASGTHTVAIYRAPAGNEAHIGPGKLTISGTSAQWSAKLEAPNGDVISNVTSAGAIFQNIMGLQGPVKMTLNAGTPPAKFIDFTIQGSTGDISGSAGGFGEYGFRNNVVAYGPTVPAVLSRYAGVWQGPQDAPICARPAVTLTVSASGAVTNAKAAGSCQAAQVTATWDGNDDYVGLASEGGYEIQLDSVKVGGSQSQGGIRILIADLDNRGPISKVSSVLAGSAGNIIASYPTGEIPAGSESKVATGPNGEDLLNTCPVPAEAGTYSLLISGGYGGRPCINGIRSVPQTQSQFCDSLFVKEQLQPGVISPTCTWDPASKSGQVSYPFGPLNVVVKLTYVQR